MVIATSKVRTMLANMGMPPNLSGFELCAEAIAMAANDPKSLRSVTRAIYPSVAEKFGTTPQRTERCIRHAIGKLYHISDLDTIEMYTTFIAAIARYLRDAEDSETEDRA